jgi:small subunit ribosomal protein S21e
LLLRFVALCSALPRHRACLRLLAAPCSHANVASSATNRLITAKDHASIQLNIGHVDQNGLYTGENTTYALSGFVRSKSNGDAAVNRLAARDGFLKNIFERPQL